MIMRTMRVTTNQNLILQSDYDYKIILEDEDSHVELDIDQQIKDLAEANKRDIYVDRDQLFNKIGPDPYGLEDNPLTGQPYENLYFKPELKRDVSYKEVMDSQLEIMIMLDMPKCGPISLCTSRGRSSFRQFMIIKSS